MEGADPQQSVLGKVVSVLRAFTVEDTVLGFAELGRRTGLAKGTLHRQLGEMVTHGLLERDAGRYRLSGLVFELGMRASVERSLLEVATPFLDELSERTHETVHLGIREGAEVVYIAKTGGHRQVDSPSRLGGRMPVHATAIGKVLLAHADDAAREAVLAAPLARRAPRTVVHVELLRRQLDAARERNLAFEHEESAVGITCVAAAVRGRGDRARAAVSVTGPVPASTRSATPPRSARPRTGSRPRSGGARTPPHPDPDRSDTEFGSPEPGAGSRRAGSVIVAVMDIPDPGPATFDAGTQA